MSYNPMTIKGVERSGESVEHDEAIEYNTPKPSVEEVGRDQLESSILATLTAPNTLKALQSHVSSSTTNIDARDTRHLSALQTAAYSRDKLRQAVAQGVKILVSASCDKRLEISHWALKRLESEDDGDGMVAWLFDEARHLKTEADGDAAEVIGRVFGV